MTFISKDAQCYDRSYCIHEFFLCVSKFLSYWRFCILHDLTPTWPGFAKYAVDYAHIFFLFNFLQSPAKLKTAQEKLLVQKISARSIPIYPANLVIFQKSWIFGVPFGRVWVPVAPIRDMIWNFTPIIS